jgi:drug/metabolite transporter (DMT)-like permease
VTAFPGEIAALSAAGLWAFATLLFGRLGKQLSPLMLNLVKGLVAIGFILLTLLLRPSATASLPIFSVGLLLMSGVIGIGLGDTAYFATVNALGPRRALLMETLAPPLSALIALIGLQETLDASAWTGILITFLGVAWVISEQVPVVRSAAPLTPLSGQGILWGCLAAGGQALGAVLSRAALADTAVDPLWSTLLRLLAGSGFMLGLMTIRPDWRRGYQPLRSVRMMGGVAIAAFFGTYLAIWLQQTALKYAATGIAQSLLATSPIFVLPMAAILGERISLRALLGALTALVGIGLLFR